MNLCCGGKSASPTALPVPQARRRPWPGRGPGTKKEDEICTSSLSSSTIPLTSGIEEAPQLLLSVIPLYHKIVVARKPLPHSAREFSHSGLRWQQDRAVTSPRTGLIEYDTLGRPLNWVTDGPLFSMSAVVRELTGSTFRSD
jgi:hypothetical protein